MTTSPPPAPDTEPARSFPVAGLETAVKAAVRAAPVPARIPMWQAWLSAADAARSASPDRLPWESPDEVAAVSMDAAKAILTAVFTAMHAAVPDPADRAGVRAVLVREIAKLESRAPESDNGARRKGPPRVCARPGCGRIFYSTQPSARSCSPACRQALHQAKRWSAREATRTANAPGT